MWHNNMVKSGVNNDSSSRGNDHPKDCAICEAQTVYNADYAPELREQQVAYHCNVRNDWNLIEWDEKY